MGAIINSFKRAFGREMGKNTGKFLSNKAFGDKWSTPHRVAIKHSGKVQAEIVQEIKANQNKKSELEIEKEYEKEMFRMKTVIEKEKEDEKKLDLINQMPISGEPEAIENVVSYLIATAKSSLQRNKTTGMDTLFGDEDKYNYAFIDACLTKAEEGIFNLRHKGFGAKAEFFEQRMYQIIQDVTKKSKSLKRKGWGIVLYSFGICFLLYWIIYKLLT